MRLPCGKIPSDVLADLLAQVPSCEDVVIGPGCGEDAAAVRTQGKIIVAASDPVTFAYERAGAYAVYINANDIATRGASARFFLATLLAPPGTVREEIEAVFQDILRACERIEVALIGGHTEITAAVRAAVVSGCMIGEVHESQLVRTSEARAGDRIIMTESAGLEGAALLARDAAHNLSDAGVSVGTIDAARRFLDVPGICILEHARIACRVGGVSAMHDPTEGGVANALYELAWASKKRVVACPERIRVREETSAICRSLGLDVLGLISSGSLLICASPESASSIVDSLACKGIPADLIGEILDGEAGVFLEGGGVFPRFERDELARYYEDIDHGD